MGVCNAAQTPRSFFIQSYFPMKRSNCYILLLCGWLLTSFATAQQNDSIRSRILSMQPSDLEIITKGRSLIVENLKKGDLVAVKEVKDYLAGEMFNPYRVFVPAEYWLLCFWTEDFTELLHEAEDYASGVELRGDIYWGVPERFQGTPMLGMIVQSDRLSEELGRKSAEAYIPLTVSVDNAELNAEEKEVLKLLLYALLFTPDRVDDEKEMEELNAKATAFLDVYPDSRYGNYTRRYIRYRFRPSDWGMGSELFLGYNQFTGGLSNHFTNRVMGGFAFDISYKKFTVSTRINFSGTKTLQEITRRDITWPKDVNGYVIGADLAFHYPVFQSRNVLISPVAGIGGMGIGPSFEQVKDEYPELEEFKELSSFNYLLGLDIKVNAWNREIDLSRYGGGYVGLRYTYYIPNLGERHQLQRGNMHTITLTVGGFGYPKKRDL